jgi:hypothetical protein
MQPIIRYELADLEKLIQSMPETKAAQHLSQEVERIKQVLSHEAFGFGDEHDVSRYVRLHQQALVTMLDKHRNSTHSQTAQVADALQDILDFLKGQFSRYFDLDTRVPSFYLARTTKDSRSNLNNLFRSLSEAGADPSLVELPLQVIRPVHDASPASVTFRRLRYANEVYRGLQRLLDRIDQVSDINEELRLLLYFLNLNSTHAVSYHARLIGTALKDIPSRIARIERLSLFRKEINQAQVKPGIAYNIHAKSLTTQVTNYITEEINYLEKIESLGKEQAAGNGRTNLTDFRIQMHASVSQLAYLVKLFMETALIQNKNLTELLQGLATFMVTKRTQVVSFDSLRAKYYNVESGTKLAVRQMLTQMIKRIDEDLR